MNTDTRSTTTSQLITMKLPQQSPPTAARSAASALSTVSEECRNPVAPETATSLEAEVKTTFGCNFILDKFQVDAIRTLVEGDNPLVTAHTGSGKSLVAYAAALHGLRTGNVVLISPIKTLSNQSYADFGRTYLRDRLGIETGDIKLTPATEESTVTIMTAETLCNKLRSNSPEIDKISMLIEDEVHWMNDEDRGNVWDQIHTLMPMKVQSCYLSATIRDADKFCDSLTAIRKRRTVLITNDKRVVPLYVGVVDDHEFRSFYSTETKLFNTRAYTEALSEQVTGVSVAHRIKTFTRKLQSIDSLPAILFCMSRKHCESLAKQVEISALDHLELAESRRTRERLMRPFKSFLERLKSWRTLSRLLDNGVAYHHAGMFQVVRELVEMLFKKKLVKILFATETLSVGVNLPTRLVGFLQLEKPSADGMRTIFPHEFFQMAGRAGRRGMDRKGLCCLVPLRSPLPSLCDFRKIIEGKMPSIKSRLRLTPDLVLRNVGRTDLVTNSLRSYQDAETARAMVAGVESRVHVPDDPLIETYLRLEASIVPRQLGSMVERICTKKLKTVRKSMGKIRREPSFDDRVGLVRRAHAHNSDIAKTMRQAEATENSSQQEWDDSLAWLTHNGYLTRERVPTALGLASMAFADGNPLIMGKITHQGLLDAMTFSEIVAWLACFGNSVVDRRRENMRTLDRKWSPGMVETMSLSRELAEGLGTSLSFDMADVMLAWCGGSRVDELIVEYGIESHQEGTLGKAVLRIINQIDHLKVYLQSADMYSIHNRLDGHTTKLLRGLVTNASLYVV